MLESLETRRLMSFTLAAGQLTVTGKPGAFNDLIKVSQQDSATIRLEDNGLVNLFADTAVSKIVINGNDGNDTLQILSTPALPLNEPATLSGGNGNDNLLGGDGADKLDGAAGNDTQRGGLGNDNLIGGDGNNGLSGQDGNDTMTAGTGADSFDGGPGIDTASYATRTLNLTITLDNSANDGQTFIVSVSPPTFKSEGDNVRDTVENIICGSGNDIVTASTTVAATNSFSGGAGNDRLDGQAGNDNLFGGAGNDVLIGRSGPDNLQGSDGNDTCLGGSGDDVMHGGNNDDLLVGGTGKDALFGEAGNDLLLAQDSAADGTVDGGTGTDIAELDAADVLRTSLEVII